MTQPRIILGNRPSFRTPDGRSIDLVYVHLYPVEGGYETFSNARDDCPPGSVLHQPFDTEQYVVTAVQPPLPGLEEVPSRLHLVRQWVPACR